MKIGRISTRKAPLFEQEHGYLAHLTKWLNCLQPLSLEFLLKCNSFGYNMQKLCIKMWLMDLSVRNCARSVYPIGICYFESVPVYISENFLYFGFF